MTELIASLIASTTTLIVVLLLAAAAFLATLGELVAALGAARP